MSVVNTTGHIIQAIRSRNVPFKAASIAFYAIASFIPLLVVALALLSVFGAADLLVELLRSQLSSSGEQVLNRVLTNTSGRGVAGALGFLIALWSGLKVFRGFSIAFDEIYAVGSDLSLVDQVIKSLTVLGLLFFALILLSTLSVVLAAMQLPFRYPTLVGNVVAFIVLVVAFLPLYYVLPPVSVTVRHVLPGTVLAALGWVLLQVAFFYYAQAAGTYAAYGFLGAILLFITFLYFGAIVILVGAVVNVVLD